MSIKQLLICLIGIIIFLGILFDLITPSIALVIGIVAGVAGWVDVKLIHKVNSLQKILLQATVVGLGFGINTNDALQVGSQSLVSSLLTITITFIVAFSLRHFVGTEKKVTTLIASGTAICGGSAIAAVSPTINANPAQTSIALAVIFVLNAIALLVFPFMGRFFELTDPQYGVWCALAIHDTSSVVGASQAFGEGSMLIATTTKLVRAFWIVPLVLVLSIRSSSNRKLSLPWFMLFFAMAVVLSSYVPQLDELGISIVWISKKLLVLVLFLIGLQITIPKLKQLGLKSIMIGIATWIALIILSLVYVINYV